MERKGDVIDRTHEIMLDEALEVVFADLSIDWRSVVLVMAHPELHELIAAMRESGEHRVTRSGLVYAFKAVEVYESEGGHHRGTDEPHIVLQVRDELAFRVIVETPPPLLAMH